MLDIIRNPVVISVVLMCVLCLLKLNVLLVLIISSMVGGIAAGMPIDQTMTIFKMCRRDRDTLAVQPERESIAEDAPRPPADSQSVCQ